MVILKHSENELEFYTLYGHLNPEGVLNYQKGDKILKGQKIGVLGDKNVNGNWAPHLHFQVMLSLLDYTIDFPGVAYTNEIATWRSICLDPNVLFRIKNLQTKRECFKQRINFLQKTASRKRIEFAL